MRFTGEIPSTLKHVTTRIAYTSQTLHSGKVYQKESEINMDTLLSSVLAAHGGLDRWQNTQTLTAHVSLGGPFWASKGWPGVLSKQTLEMDTHREHLVYTPFTAPDRRSVFDVDPERLTILDTDGHIIESRTDLRASFDGYDHSTRWDAVQVAYFSSYATWNYLTEPFLFTYPGVQAYEIDPWQEEGQTWRRLHVTFPDTIVTHSQEQTFYYDADGMQRRMDYIVDINGSVEIAHYSSDFKTFDGFVFPTHRLVHYRHPDNTADLSFASITIDFQDITVK
jgi:hypothetical protein